MARLIPRPVLLLLILALSPLPVRSATDIAVSAHDTREYAAFTLPNRLRVLVISDPSVDKAACALDVFVGSNADPDRRHGLAHFLEHMLFLGTRKYPKPDAFEAFITKHAGTRNAYTGFEHTNYYFDVGREHLREALDRFGQFFIAPAFTETYVDRERRAVDAEFHTKQRDDAWRRRAVTKQLMNPRHPLSRFAGGNFATLDSGKGEEAAGGEGTIREELLAFYHRYYSANLMTLAVLGGEPVRVIEKWVRGIFSAVPDFDAAPPRIKVPLFTEDRLPVRAVIRPVREQRTLRLSFPVPPLASHYKTKPLYYIAHILGHEGKGSLLSLLKARSWAEGLSAGTNYNHRDGALFTVSITLTEKGMARTEEITGLVFETLRLIRTEGVRGWLFEELAQLTGMDFLFQEELPPMDYTSALASALHEYPMPDVLRGPVTVEDYDEDLILAYLAPLKPENALMIVTEPGAGAAPSQSTGTPWLRTPWFDAPYRVEALDPARMEKWRTDAVAGLLSGEGSASLTIPGPNPFIPQDLAMKPITGKEASPRRIEYGPGLELWFHQDATYAMPRASFYFSIRSPAAFDTPRHAVLTKLLAALVEDRLTEFTYPAGLAGLEYEIYPHSRGISVRIEGYNDKQALLLAGILDALKGSRFDEARFQIARERLTRGLRNRRKQVPYRRAITELHDLLPKPRWTTDALLDVLTPGAADAHSGNRQGSMDCHERPSQVDLPCAEKITLPDLRAFVPEFFARLSLVALSHGNIREAETREMADILRKRLLDGATPTDVPRAGVVRLARGSAYLRVLEPEHPDAAIAIYLQGQNRSFRQRAGIALLGQLLKSAFFNQLRTEQQLGYVVSAHSFPLLEVPSLLFLIQSPHTDPAALAVLVEGFLDGQARVLETMEPAEFEGHKAALAARILEREERLGVRSDRYWREIDQGCGTFDCRERHVRALDAITRDDVVHLYRTLTAGKEESRLTIQVPGNPRQEQEDDGRIERKVGSKPAPETAPEAAPGSVIIRDPEQFKRDMDVFPEHSGTMEFFKRNA